MSANSSPKGGEEIQVKSSFDFGSNNNIYNNNFDKPYPIILSKKIICILLTVISLNHAFIYISPGILSSCITQIKFEMKLSD